jgi:hypothetical protein
MRTRKDKTHSHPVEFHLDDARLGLPPAPLLHLSSRVLLGMSYHLSCLLLVQKKSPSPFVFFYKQQAHPFFFFSGFVRNKNQIEN